MGICFFGGGVGGRGMGVLDSSFRAYVVVCLVGGGFGWGC